MPLTPRVCRRGRRFESVKQELQFQLEISPELSSRRRRGLAVSVGLHVASGSLLHRQSGPAEESTQANHPDCGSGLRPGQVRHPGTVPSTGVGTGPAPPAIAENIPPQAEAVPPPVAARRLLRLPLLNRSRSSLLRRTSSSRTTSLRREPVRTLIPARRPARLSSPRRSTAPVPKNRWKPLRKEMHGRPSKRWPEPNPIPARKPIRNRRLRIPTP